MVVGLQRMGRADEAGRCFQRAIEQDTTDPQLWYVYGDYLLEAERYQDAIDAFNRILRIQPNDRMVVSKRAHAYSRLNLSGT